MELRRYKNILALRTEPNRFLGFHSLNMELAEIDQAAWDSMSAITVDDSQIPALVSLSTEALQELESWNSFENPETGDARLLTQVRSFTINIAQVCNLACTYCAAGGDGTYGSNVAKLNLETTYSQLKWLIEKVPNGEDFKIHFIGGEPLLYPSIIRDLASYARLQAAGRINVEFAITTNGTLITSKVADLLADLKAEVVISLDGDQETNDKTRPKKGGGSLGSTAMTLRGLEELKRVRSQLSQLKVTSVFGAHNMEVVKSYEFLQSIGIEWDTMNINYANNDKDAENSAAYVSQMALVADLAYKRKGLMGLAQILQFRSPLSRLEAQTRVYDYCGAGKSLLKTDTRGDLYYCNWLMVDEKEKLGSKTDLAQWPSFEDNLIEMNNCQTCWNRHICGGGCMAVHKTKTGSKHSKDPHFCNRSRSLSALAIRYYFETVTNEETKTGELHETH